MPFILAILCGLQAWSLVISLLNRKDIKLMATRAELDAAISDLSTQLSTVNTDLTTAISDLEAKIASTGVGDDFTEEVANLKVISDSLSVIDTAVKTADPGPQPVAGS